MMESPPRLWPDIHVGPWRITLRWEMVSGRPECVGMDVASEPIAPLTTYVLRGIKIGEMVAEERERLAVNLDLPVSDRRPTEVGMREATRKRLHRVADTYRKAWQQGKPTNKAVAKRLGITESAANALIFRARQVGMLPPTSPGVATGTSLSHDTPPTSQPA